MNGGAPLFHYADMEDGSDLSQFRKFSTFLFWKQLFEALKPMESQKKYAKKFLKFAIE
jgi:hypothetical protein